MSSKLENVDKDIDKQLSKIRNKKLKLNNDTKLNKYKIFPKCESYTKLSDYSNTSEDISKIHKNLDTYYYNKIDSYYNKKIESDTSLSNILDNKPNTNLYNNNNKKNIRLLFKQEFNK
jgi:hypothetical protein